MLCPNCQQDTLLEGKAKQVCINCGYSRLPGAGEQVEGKAVGKATTLKQVQSTKNQIAKSPDSDVKTTREIPVPAAKVPTVKEDKVKSEVPVFKSAAPKPKEKDDRLVVPKHHTKVIVTRRLARLVGDKPVAVAQEGLSSAAATTKSFWSTYLQELAPLWQGQIGRYIIIFGIVMGLLVVGLLVFTFLH